MSKIVPSRSWEDLDKWLGGVSGLLAEHDALTRDSQRLIKQPVPLPYDANGAVA